VLRTRLARRRHRGRGFCLALVRIALATKIALIVLVAMIVRIALIARIAMIALVAASRGGWQGLARVAHRSNALTMPM